MEQSHSGVGIASFIVSVVASMFMFVLFVAAGAIEASTPGGMDEQSPIAVVIGLVMFGLLFLCLVGVGLGIAGMMQQQRKKIFAILGTIFSVVTIIVTIGLLMIGLSTMQ